ncbi:hypothetical protein ACLD0W_03710 [Alloalcanivorax sp. C16-1]|uniref:hypothetical protein n=1 Tax=Alloalcanivorax sp. C16-1 TaxID=3390051 RepID=UPI003971104D
MKEEDNLFESKLYADLEEAWKDVKGARGAGETAAKTTTLAGKTVWNTAVLAAKLGAKCLKEAPRIIEEHKKRSY